MKNLKFFSAFLLITFALYFGGCGDDTTTTPGGGSGSVPTLNMKVGSVYIYNLDSLPVSGGNPIHTRLLSYDTIKAKGTFNGQNDAYMITSSLRDTAFPIVPLGTTTYYVRYDGGKFYQYGVLQLISPTIPATWDLVADFNVTQGTSFNIASGVAIPNIPGATANITGKIAVDTTFNASGFGNVNCFRSEIVADISISGLPVGKVYVDYYIGDADPSTNPSGSVRVKLRPVNISGIFTQTGLDKYLQRYIPGP
jgi:hypothetical protein